MNTIDTFKTVLDGFFTKAHCTNHLKDEDDFQEKVAEHLGGNGFYVIRELRITEEELPEIRQKLNQSYMKIDIVAYRDGLFFPVELKFENIHNQTKHVSKEEYDEDGRRMGIIYQKFKDVAVARTRVLTNNKTVRDEFGPDENWHELTDGQRGEEEFMWQWHWRHDGITHRSAEDSFVRFWNNSAQYRIDHKTEKKGDNLCVIK